MNDEISFSTLAGLTLPIIEKLCNAIIAQDAVTQSNVSALNGKIIKVETTRPAHCVYMCFFDNTITLQHVCEVEPNLYIRAPLSALLKLVKSNNTTVTILSEDIHIIGDAALAQHLQTILQNLEIDWEAHLAKGMGGVTAHQVANTLRSVGSKTNQKGLHFFNDVKEYLQEELRIIPNSAEVEHVRDEVGALKLKIDRLEAHITKLTEKLHSQ